MLLSRKTQADQGLERIDRDADLSVTSKLPFLVERPVLKNRQSNVQRRWRLYHRIVPILGQIPLVSEIQPFWAIPYLLGEIELPKHETVEKEIAEWNAWMRKRYLSQGQKFPYSLYDFLPVSNSSFLCIKRIFASRTICLSLLLIQSVMRTSGTSTLTLAVKTWD